MIGSCRTGGAGSVPTVAIGTQAAPHYPLGFDPEDWLWRTRPAQPDTQSERTVDTQPPHRQPSSPNRQTSEENLYAIRYGWYGKLRQHRSLYMRTMARVTRLFLFHGHATVGGNRSTRGTPGSIRLALPPASTVISYATAPAGATAFFAAAFASELNSDGISR
jgi:hypothetical protein